MVGHVRHESLESDRRLQIYWNYLQRARDRMAVVVRASDDPRRLTSSVLAAIKAVDPDQPAYAIHPMTEVLDRSLAIRWFNTVMVALFAGASLLLALLGIYGVIAWNVTQRTREIGIRMALGARRRLVLGLVLQHGLRLALAGIILGLLGAMFLTRFLRSLLFGVAPTDPLTFAAVPIFLVSAALLASFLPACRAIKVDPMQALRTE
jgi:ABC-type antimicrobial peptide transport system permease subunit